MINQQATVKKTDAVTNRLIYFFIFILLISIAGFYKTYLIRFPRFEEFTWAHHFHGAIMLSWVLILIAQPIFIRVKKLRWHKITGKISYFVFPLLVLSFFLVARAGYFRNIKAGSEADALAGMVNGIPDMFYISILYGLGIYYKRKTAYHLRFFASIGLMILGPGLGRFLIAVCGLSFIAIPIMIMLIAVITLIWMIIDIIQKRSAFPMSVFLMITITALTIGSNSHSQLWQHFAKFIAVNFF